MSGTPQYKVFDAAGKYQAAFKEIEAAASIMGFYGDGATIRIGHSKADTVWTEGAEDRSAMESYDHVAIVANKRRRERLIRGHIKLGASLADFARMGVDPSEVEALK